MSKDGQQDDGEKWTRLSKNTVSPEWITLGYFGERECVQSYTPRQEKLWKPFTRFISHKYKKIMSYLYQPLKSIAV